MSKQWFVLNTLTGQEQKVQKLLVAKAAESEIDLAGMIGEPLIHAGLYQTEQYIYLFFDIRLGCGLCCYNFFVELKLPHAIYKYKKYVNGLDGVIGFLGGDYPRPMTDEEVANVKASAGGEEAKAKPKVTFEPGEPVKIVDGAFMASEGTVQSVDPDRGRLVVSVSIFGGDTPVELEYWQVERLEKKDPAAGA